MHLQGRLHELPINLCMLKEVYRQTDRSTYIDKFENLFEQLQCKGPDTEITEKHKVPLLLDSMGHDSSLESTIEALRLKDTDDLT